MLKPYQEVRSALRHHQPAMQQCNQNQPVAAKLSCSFSRRQKHNSQRGHRNKFCNTQIGSCKQFNLRPAMRNSTSSILFLSSLLHATSTTYAFQTFTAAGTRQRPALAENHALGASIAPPELSMLSDDNGLSLDTFQLTIDETNPLIRLGEGEKEKVVNAFGLWCAAVSLFTGPIWMLAMMLVDAINESYQDWDPHRAIYDTTGKIWAKVWLTMTNSFPTVSGEPLMTGRPCLYVANHASWLDIPVLCTVLDPVFKFIAKGELAKVPCIGQQLHGGNHILIDREDRRSQLRTFKEGLAWLNKGVPIMAFPEGMRSRDGRLMEFKKGIFSLAAKANVPIVPITLANTHAVMPGFSYFPVQSGKGKIHVHVGKAINAEGRTEAELEELVRQEFIAHLPASQLPLTTAAVDEKAEADLQTA